MSAVKAQKGLIQKSQNLQVFVRCRPLNLSESKQRGVSVVNIPNQKEISIQDRANSKIVKTYSFDRVFGPSSSQIEVYQHVVEPLISDVLAGFNCTVFAYGQTGSGKSFTIEGENGSEEGFSLDPNAGLIPRALFALFDELRSCQSEYTVRISFLELYNEELFDLFSPDEVPPKLKLFDDPTKKGSVVVQGLQEIMVHTQSQVLAELRKGIAKRQIAATLMNAHSSRSHTIFSVTVHFKESYVNGEQLLRMGKLNLVDLAGSENIAKSGSVDKRAREAASINQSLLTLSRVTSCLVEHQPHVPYRESKLTRLLQDSLGGRTKSTLIATISPANFNVEETLSTLDYACRAKHVANKPEVNQKVTQEVISKEYSDLIADLKTKLDQHRNGSGIYINPENYEQMMSQTRERNQSIRENIEKIKLVCQMKKSVEAVYADLSRSVMQRRQDVETVNNTILKISERIKLMKDILTKVTSEKQQGENLLGFVSDTEKKLRTQAQQLTSIACFAHEDSEKVHARLQRSREVLERNRGTLEKLEKVAKSKLDSVERTLEPLSAGRNLTEKLILSIDNWDESLKERFQVIHKIFQQFFTDVNALFQSVESASRFWQEKWRQSAEDLMPNVMVLEQKLVEVWENVEQLSEKAASQYYLLMSQVPESEASLLNLDQKIMQSLKELHQAEITKMAKERSAVERESRFISQHIINQSHEVSSLEEECLALKHWKLSDEIKSNIAALCLQSKSESSTRCKSFEIMQKDLENRIVSIPKDISACPKYHQQKLTESLGEWQAHIDLANDKLAQRRCSMQDAMNNIRKTVSKGVDVANLYNHNLQSIFSNEIQSSYNQILMKLKADQSHCDERTEPLIGAIDDSLCNFEHISQTTDLQVKEIVQQQKCMEKELHVTLCAIEEAKQYSQTKMVDTLETGNADIDVIVNSEFGHDIPTGGTPVRKVYGTIPQLESLSSPIMKTVLPRVQKANWRRLLLSSQKPLVSADTRENVEDDSMASDTEVLLSKKTAKIRDRSSSLSDLRLNEEFRRPRIPKKLSRKVL